MKTKINIVMAILAMMTIFGQGVQAATSYAGLNCTYQREEMACRVCAIYFEAGNQSYNGKVQVGKTIETRMAADSYPTTACGNVYQSAQFSFVSKICRKRGCKLPNEKVIADSVKAAIAARDSGPNSATNYHATSLRGKRKPAWTRNCHVVNVVDQHIFYRCPGIITDREIAEAQAEAEAQAKSRKTQLASTDQASKVAKVVKDSESRLAVKVAARPATTKVAAQVAPPKPPSRHRQSDVITQQAAIDDIVMGEDASR